MQPLGKQPSHQPTQPPGEPEAEVGPTRAPASAVNAIMGRLGLARPQDEPEADEAILTQNLADLSWAVRVSAVQKLGKMGKQAPLGLLLAALRDEQGSVRVAAVRALSRNPRQAAISALVAVLDDHEWLVRAEAALALGEMREMAPLEPLLALLQDADATVRASAARALGETGDTQALVPLQKSLQDDDWSVRESATLALALLGVEGQIEPAPLLSRTNHAQREASEADDSPFSHAENSSVSSEPATELTRWLEHLQSAHPTLLTTVSIARPPQPVARRNGKKRGHTAKVTTPGWPRKAMHTAEGVLAAVIITGLFVAWLAIETQPRSTQGQTSPGNSRSLTFTTYREHDSEVKKLAWSPDGQNIASADSKGNVRVWQAGTGKTLLVNPHSGIILALTWSNSTTVLVAYVEQIRDLRVEELFLGPEQLPYQFFHLPNLPSAPTYAAWASDKQMLAFETGDGSVQIWNVFNDQKIASIQEKHVEYSELAWSPDDKQLATLSTTGLLETWNSESGQPIHTLSYHLAAIFAWVSCGHYARYSSGRLLVAANNALQDWSYDRLGQQIRSFMPEQNYNIADTANLTITALAISPDDSQVFLATSDGPVQARDIQHGSLIYLYTGHSAQVNDIEWSPNGQHIATASMDTTVRVWQET
ncbi:MAG TPA: HEAT repeat domain-containing protein [Ktedonobacteraceae bacterium]